MNNQNDGGPAFPQPTHHGDGIQYLGISMRDYFAAHAPVVPEDFDGQMGETQIERMIRWRWFYADAMLAERMKVGAA